MGGTTSFPALVGDAKMYPKDTIGQVVTDRPRTLRFSEGFTYHRCMITREGAQECDVLDENGRKVFKILENDITVIQRAAAEAAVPMAQIEKSLVPESRRDVLNVVFFPSKNTVTPVAAVDRAVTAQPNTAAVSVATPVAITATEDTASRAPIGMSVNHEFVVDKVEADSQAHSLGVREGMKVTACNGQLTGSTALSSAAQLYETLGAADGPMAIVFATDGNDAAKNDEAPVCVIRSLNREALSLSGKKIDLCSGSDEAAVAHELLGRAWAISTLEPNWPGQRPVGEGKAPYTVGGRPLFDVAEVKVAKDGEGAVLDSALGNSCCGGDGTQAIYSKLTPSGPRPIWSWADSKGTGRMSTIIQHNGNQLPVEQVQVVGIATPNDIKVAGNMDPVAALSLGFIFRQQIANQFFLRSDRAQLLFGWEIA